MALGSLIIKEKLGISDRETIEQIKENPYLQYFLGMSSYSNEAPFDASLMVYFRERIDKDLVNKINEKMVNNLAYYEQSLVYKVMDAAINTHPDWVIIVIPSPRTKIADNH